MTNSGDRCINPSGIRNEDLIAFAEGEADPTATEHIERCQFCQKEARAYARTGAIMSAVLTRRSCVPTETLGEYALGTLASTRMREVAEHLLDCPHCLAESRSIAAFLSEPDESVLEPGLAGALRRLIARRLDAPTPALAGLRGTATDEMATFVADDCLVRLSVQSGTPGRPGKVLVGLLEQRAGIPAGATARLYENDRLLQTEEVDDLGNFMFNAVLQGTYRIEVTSGDAIVVIETVQVD
jgi:anti-sigma factor RsiW